MARSPLRRSGFSLVELLVVMGLLAVLAAIAATAAFRASSSAKVSATQKNIQRIDSLVQKRISEIAAQASADARKRAIPSTVMSFCGNDTEAAGVVWTYLKLKHEMPTTFLEAITQIKLGGVDVLELRPQAAYVSEFSIVGVAKPCPTSDGSSDAKDFHESAACLYKMLEKTDKIEAMSNIGMLPNGEFRCFVDSWNRPIAFSRISFSGELNSSPYLNAAGRNSNDPLDPQNRLASAAFPAANLPLFWREATRDHLKYQSDTTIDIPALATDGYPANNATRNWTFAVISGGDTTLKAGAGNDVYFGANPFGSAGAEADNIVSYRLRADKKGF